MWNDGETPTPQPEAQGPAHFAHTSVRLVWRARIHVLLGSPLQIDQYADGDIDRGCEALGSITTMTTTYSLRHRLKAWWRWRRGATAGKESVPPQLPSEIHW